MERSDQINELAAALALAQAEIEKADKDRTNPAFRSNYATLGSVWDAAKEALTKHGLSVAQIPEPSEKGTLALTTMLLHKSGQFVAGTITMPLAREDPQGYGSAMTYARRYGLSAMVGVCPEDDDGNAATHGHSQGSRGNPAPRHEQAVRGSERPLTEGRKSLWATSQPAESRGDAAAAEDLNLTAPTEKPRCADCGTDNMPPRVVEFSIKHFSVPVCFDCGKKRKAAA